MFHSEKISQWEFSTSKHLSIKYTELSQNTAALLFFLFNISKSLPSTTTNRGYNASLSFFSFLLFFKPSQSDTPLQNTLQNTEINHHKETSKLPLGPHFPADTKPFKNVLFGMFQIRSKPILCLILCMNDTLKNYVTDVCWLNVFFSSTTVTETLRKNINWNLHYRWEKTWARLAQHLQILKTLGFSSYYPRAVRIPQGTLTFFPAIRAKLYSCWFLPIPRFSDNLS